MNVAGIIAEYNPFHNGHKYHIEKTKEITHADYLIVVMSGNYVQRGEPAIIDKWTRTKMALENGADIVIELPSIYSTSSAENFAYSSVGLLNSTNIVSSICFGSEINDINSMKEIAEILCNEPYEYKNILKNELSKGIVFPAARANALKTYTNKYEIINTPNNILGVEYIKSIIKLKSSIVPYAIKRNDFGYHSNSISNNTASASAIRNALKNNDKQSILNVMPKNSIDMFFKCIDDGTAPIFIDDLSMLLQYKLRILNSSEIALISDVTEGLENRILNSARNNFYISDIISDVKTKRYTYTKIQRALLHILLDFKNYDLHKYNKAGYCQYIKVLGFRKNSECVLSELCSKSSIPVITNIKKAKGILLPIGMDMLNKELNSTDIYFLANPNVKQRVSNKEYTEPIVIY